MSAMEPEALPSTPEPEPKPEADGAPPSQFLLRGWNDPAVLGVALVAVAVGFGQFGLTATLGNVARHFGHLVNGTSITDQAGLSGTQLGLGLAVIRLASLGGLPLAGLADRAGRRRVLLVACGLGLAATAASVAAPGYWWFVLVFALGRPFLSAASALAQVQAAELTSSAQRASAVALVAAGYAVGAGVTAVVYGLAGNTLGYRGILLLAVVPLVALPFTARWVTEPDRFVRMAAGHQGQRPVLGAVARPYRARLALVAVLAFSLGVITGPANTFVFLYAQNVAGFSGIARSAMVVGAGILGLGGLLAGRWLADRVGRRPIAMAAMILIGAFGDPHLQREPRRPGGGLCPGYRGRRRHRPLRRRLRQRAVPDLGPGIGGGLECGRFRTGSGGRAAGLRCGGRRRRPLRSRRPGDLRPGHGAERLVLASSRDPWS